MKIILGLKTRTNGPKENTYILPPGIILSIKRDANGNISRDKVHLVVRGNFQSDDFDFATLYALVACIEIIRLMLAIAV